LVYVIDGSGKIVVEGKVFPLHPGDMVIIDQNEKYYWDGTLELLAVCTPAWNAKQSKSLDL
jgi:mannose-6-phosphate isomerase-like protein (cupin superfamily)